MNETLLKYYRKGWNDCFGGKPRKIKNKLLQRAYDIGWLDYIVGDDVSSVDLQTEEEILEKIKRKNG
jgi:hypothetical protein